MKKNIFIGSLILMLAIIVFSVSIYQASSNPYQKAEKEAFTIAQESAGVTSLDEFYWYNGDQTYFTVIGPNQEQTPVVVIIAQDGGTATTFNLEDVVSEKQAIQLTRQAVKPKEVLEARIGIEEDTAVWEVAYKQENGQLGYYIISLETGEWIKGIENI